MNLTRKWKNFTIKQKVMELYFWGIFALLVLYMYKIFHTIQNFLGKIVPEIIIQLEQGELIHGLVFLMAWLLNIGIILFFTLLTLVIILVQRTLCENV